MKKMNLLILALVIVVVSVAGFIFHKSNVSKNDSTTKAPFKYEILDSNIALSDSLKGWVDSNKEKAGFSTKKEGDFTYVIVSAGKKDTTGYGIGLKKVEDGSKVKVIYEIVSPNKSEKVEQKETYPHMLIRVTCGDKSVEGINETAK